MKSLFSKRPRYYCKLPWEGALSIQTNGDVVLCPCFAKVKLGNIKGSSLAAMWNARPIRRMRRYFRKGHLPPACRGQRCPAVLKAGAARLNA